jgi:hypothetical protein
LKEQGKKFNSIQTIKSEKHNNMLSEKETTSLGVARKGKERKQAAAQ